MVWRLALLVAMLGFIPFCEAHNESDHSANMFTTRLLLHHFLNENDLQWLDTFKEYDLNDSQKKGLIFLREAGAIDNSTYRQLNACDVLRASNELRILRDKELIVQKGKGKATYYIAGNNLTAETVDLNTYGDDLNTYGNGLNTYGIDVTTEPASLKQELPAVIREKIELLGRRESDIEKIRELVYGICRYRSCSLKELSALLNRKENTIYRNYIVPLKQEGRLQYTIPDMPKHPNQAYKAI